MVRQWPGEIGGGQGRCVGSPLGHLRVTVGHPRVTIGHLRATELHPKVRQTCQYPISFYILNYFVTEVGKV